MLSDPYMVVKMTTTADHNSTPFRIRPDGQTFTTWALGVCVPPPSPPLPPLRHHRRFPAFPPKFPDSICSDWSNLDGITTVQNGDIIGQESRAQHFLQNQFDTLNSEAKAFILTPCFDSFACIETQMVPLFGAHTRTLNVIIWDARRLFRKKKTVLSAVKSSTITNNNNNEIRMQHEFEDVTEEQQTQYANEIITNHGPHNPGLCADPIPDGLWVYCNRGAIVDNFLDPGRRRMQQQSFRCQTSLTNTDEAASQIVGKISVTDDAIISDVAPPAPPLAPPAPPSFYTKYNGRCDTLGGWDYIIPIVLDDENQGNSYPYDKNACEVYCNNQADCNTFMIGYHEDFIEETEEYFYYTMCTIGYVTAFDYSKCSEVNNYETYVVLPLPAPPPSAPPSPPPSHEVIKDGSFRAAVLLSNGEMIAISAPNAPSRVLTIDLYKTLQDMKPAHTDTLCKTDDPHECVWTAHYAYQSHAFRSSPGLCVLKENRRRFVQATRVEYITCLWSQQASLPTRR